MTPPAGGPHAAPVQIEIVVPARNEARRLPRGLAALCRQAAALPIPAAVLVVDSASTDATVDLVRRWPAGPVPVRLLCCARPGKGLAVRAGRLAASVVENRHSAVRRAGAAVFRAMARTVVPGATDTQCGFKFFSGPLARAAAQRLTTPGFAFDIELIALCQRLGATLTEFPVHWRDMPGSTFSVPRHSAAAMRDVASIWLSHRPGRVAAGPAPAGALEPGPPEALPAGATPA